MKLTFIEKIRLDDIEELKRAKARLDTMAQRYRVDGYNNYADSFAELSQSIDYAITDIEMILGIHKPPILDDDIPF